MKRSLRQVKALAFDVFGTVVDWRGSLIAEGRKLGRRKRIRANWAAFADAWRAGYRPAMNRVRSGDQSACAALVEHHALDPRAVRR